MWHYGMCVDTVRNSTAYTVYDSENVFCDHEVGRYVNFDDDKRCSDTCDPAKYVGTHPSYGLICVTDPQCSGLGWTTDTAPNVCEIGCLPTEYFNPDTSGCVTTCPSPKYHSPAGYTPLTCLDVCPGPSSSPAHTVQTWGIAATQTCVDLAGCKADSKNTFNSTWLCIDDAGCNAISSNLVVQDWDDCATACPVVGG
jgi:hypothetical protein